MEQQLIPLNIPQKLAPTPKNLPKYQKAVKNLKGEEVILADPKATRAFVALMNQNAVTGGAAAHTARPRTPRSHKGRPSHRRTTTRCRAAACVEQVLQIASDSILDLLEDLCSA